MGAPAAGTFAVLAASKEDLRSAALPKALGEALGRTALDGALLVRRCGGILREGLTWGEAEHCADLLQAAGVATRIVPSAALDPLPPARILARAAPAPDGLDVLVRGGGEETIAWTRIALLAVGPWQETTRTEVKGNEGPTPAEMTARAGVMAVSGLPIGLGKRKEKKKTVTKTEFRLLLDLHLGDPEDRLRVDGNRFDYSGLGKAMAFNALANIKALTAVLAAAVPDAPCSRGTDLLLQGGRLASLGYTTEEDFLREQRWMRALRG